MQQRIKSNLEAAAFIRGEAMISFAGSFVYFKVYGHEETQMQRMTMAAAAGFSGGQSPVDLVFLCEDLLGGQAHNPTKLIATPTYGYRMVISEKSNAIYREYMPPRSSGNDDFSLNDAMFSDYWFTLKAHRARRLICEAEVGDAVNAGLIVNGFAQGTLSGSARTFSLQFPIRYFSVLRDEQSRFHAEAGPIIVPSACFGENVSESSESMYIAQLGFNRWDEGEIAIWSAERTEFAASRWYSRVRKVPAQFSFLVQD